MAKEITVVKRNKNGSALLSNGYVRTPIVRICFANVAAPRANQEDPSAEPKYGVTLLFNKGEDLSLLKLAFDRKVKEVYPSGPPKKFKKPFRDQAEKSDEYDGFKDGAVFFNATSKFKPQTVGRDPSVAMEPSAFYSGCWVRATLNLYDYDQKGNKGIAFGLQSLQFIRDDEPLGGGVAASETFEDEGGDADSDDDNDLIG